MSTLMEFWGVEVKSGQLLKINPGDNKIVHLSQASLGEVKKDEGGHSVRLYLNVDDKKLVLGTLSSLKFPQISFDLVIEKDFELSHNWKHGSVFFTGYKLCMDKGTEDNSGSDEEVEEIQLLSNGQSELRLKPANENLNAVKPSTSTAKQNMKDVKRNLNVDDSDSDDTDLSASSSDDDETSDDENPILVNRKSGNDDEDDEDSDESDSDDEDEETPKKAEPTKKRPAESATKTPVPEKKAKFITPEKTEGRKGISHTVTPHPSKKSGKAPANTDQTKQQQPKKSGGPFPCKSCNRSFTTEIGLQSHTKAKHSGTA